MAKVIFLHLVQILSFYTMFQTIHAQHQNHSGFSLRMLHWNSPELPSHKPHQTHEELIDELIHMSNARIKAIEHLTRVINSSHFTNDEQPIRPKLEAIISRGIYLVQVGIGTFPTNPPYQQNYLMLDTLDDHTWTQCEGCAPCFPQRGPHFQWNRSSTYRISPSGHCVINLPFGVSGHIRGTVARDTFTFESENGYVRIPDRDFICVFGSQGYKGEITGPADVESGMFSLSRQGYSSLMRNVQNPIINNGRFSYCLPPLGEPIIGSMYLRFGQDIRLSHSKQLYTTPILQSHVNLYYIKLLGLSVGRTPLQIDPQVFHLKSDGSGGCAIDPGISFSYIPRLAYYQLETLLAQKYGRKNHRIVARVHPSPVSGLSLCYKQLTPEIPISPTITFHFDDNANLLAATPMKQYTFGSRRLHCLPIMPGGPTTVIGATKQANHRFVYDIRRSLLHFHNDICP